MAFREAFIALLDYKQAKILKEMPRRVYNHDDMVRIAAQFELVQHLRDAPRWIAEIEKGLKNAE